MEQGRNTVNVSNISIVVATYNRCNLLAKTLKSVLAQAGEASYEIIVIDNNSTDRTRSLVEELIRQGHKLLYQVEQRQGVSYARNSGIALASAPILAFLDDDVRASRNWVQTIKQTFDEFPDVGCIGGPVLPDWESKPPAWLTRDHWAPLALQDYGSQRFIADNENRRCLVSANLAVRREALDLAGQFSPDLQRVKDGIGSMEDLELLHRFWRAGIRVMYQPSLLVTASVPLNRMSFSYHRRWHFGHGGFYARLHSEEIERSRIGRFLGVPAHLFRKAFADALKWCLLAVMGRRSRAFRFEIDLCFFAGFVRKRAVESLAAFTGGAFRRMTVAVRTFTSRLRKPQSPGQKLHDSKRSEYVTRVSS